jgi:hypothetical protein
MSQTPNPREQEPPPQARLLLITSPQDLQVGDQTHLYASRGYVLAEVRSISKRRVVIAYDHGSESILEPNLASFIFLRPPTEDGKPPIILLGRNYFPPQDPPIELNNRTVDDHPLE